MPVFHDLRTLFIHIPKNAGRSIEEALLRGHGTPDSGRRNLLNRAATLLQRKSASPFATDHLIGTLDHAFASQHLTYLEIAHLRLLPEDVLNGYRTFCVCRNPYDRAVSTVLHFAEEAGEEPITTASAFEEKLNAWLDRPKSDHNLVAHDRPQSDYVVDDRGRMAIETVLRFENLAEDFARLATSLGMPENSLTWFGKASRSRRYQDYFTPDARKAVERKYGEDLDRFGYTYEGE